MKRKILATISLPLFVLLYSSAFAHVVVKPATTGIGTYQIFTVSVPTEKTTPTVALRLEIPSGVEYVTPTVKSGWKITTKKEGTTTDAPVTEILWTDGTVPAGMRDEFSFSAKTPITPTMLIWKAYQTYSDGSVVSWEVSPANDTMSEKVDTGPYSTTDVVDDVTEKKTNTQNIPLYVSIVALVLSLRALYLIRK